MNRSTGFRNKLIYLAILIAMLIPLYLLGQPAGGSTGDAGGQLTQMRTKFNIAESELGDINPASETMKLASLGLRGVAATLLWNNAHECRKTHEWDRLKATLNSIALLQPHYEKVWEFQAHNLAYNVSTEFDDYRQRYAMVREGTEFLTQGVEQNRKAPRLVWYTGWFYGQKMGMSDEKRQFRKLFADDNRLHDSLREHDINVDSPDARGPENKPDNWLVGRLWLNHGYDIVDNGVKIRNQTPINFFETGPKWRIKHAEAIESEGVLDDRAKDAWVKAGDDWTTLGKRSIPTTAAFTIKMGSLDELERQLADTKEEFLTLVGDTMENEKQALLSALTVEERTAWDTNPDDRTQEQATLATQLYYRLQPSLDTVAKKSPPAVRLRAIELNSLVGDLEARIQKTAGHRTQINYDYWSTLTKAEQEDRTIQARRLLYDAEKANARAELDLAISKYEEAFALWAKVFDDYPVLTLDDLSEDLVRAIRRYTIAIDKEDFDEDFPLLDFVTMMSGDTRSAAEYERLRKLQAEKLKAKEEEQIKAELEAEAASKSEATGDEGVVGPTDGSEAKPEMTEAAENATPGDAAADSQKVEPTDEPVGDDAVQEKSDDSEPSEKAEATSEAGEGEPVEGEPVEGEPVEGAGEDPQKLNEGDGTSPPEEPASEAS